MKQQKWKSKSFALLLAVMMMFTMMPQMVFADEQAVAPQEVSSVSGGERIIVSSAAELAALGGKELRGTVELAADIDMSGTTMQPIKSLKGTFEGNGHTISNLTLSGEAGTRWDAPNVGLGLIAQLNGTVQNLKMDNVQITSNSKSKIYAGAIVGMIEAANASIANCAATGTITLPETSTQDGAGGIVGGVLVNGSVVITDVYSEVSITNGKYTGGLIGIVQYAQKVTIQNCAVVGDLKVSTGGGIIGWLTSVPTTAERVYFGGAITGSTRYGFAYNKNYSSTLAATSVYYDSTKNKDSNTWSKFEAVASTNVTGSIDGKSTDELKSLKLEGFTPSAEFKDYPVPSWLTTLGAGPHTVTVTAEGASKVTLLSKEGNPIDMTAAREGMFTASLAEGQYTYTAEANLAGKDTATGTLVVGKVDKAMTITLPNKVADTEITVDGPAETVLKVYQGKDATDTLMQAKSVENGVHTYALNEGSYYYEATAEEYETASGTFTVPVADSKVTVTMTASPKYDVTFDIKSGEKTASVKVFRGEKNYQAKAEAGMVYALCSGDYSYEVTAEDCITKTGEFKVEGEAKTVTVTLDGVTGDGSAARPFVIDSKEALVYFAQQVNSSVKKYVEGHVKLSGDIDLQNMSWTPIGPSWTSPFRGHLDGAGHTISGLNVTNARTYYGFFGCLDNATVENLTLKGQVYCAEPYARVGGLAGYAIGDVTIRNCGSAVNVSALARGCEGVGGLVGGYEDGIDYRWEDHKMVIENSYNVGNIVCTGSDANTTIGGLVGGNKNCVQLENCYNAGTVYGPGVQAAGLLGNAGGQTGDNCKPSMKGCYNAGQVVGVEGKAFGLYGKGTIASVNLQDCYVEAGTAANAKPGTTEVSDDTRQEMLAKLGSGWTIDPDKNNGKPYLNGTDPVAADTSLVDELGKYADTIAVPTTAAVGSVLTALRSEATAAADIAVEITQSKDDIQKGYLTAENHILKLLKKNESGAAVTETATLTLKKDGIALSKPISIVIYPAAEKLTTLIDNIASTYTGKSDEWVVFDMAAYAKLNGKSAKTSDAAKENYLNLTINALAQNNASASDRAKGELILGALGIDTTSLTPYGGGQAYNNAVKLQAMNMNVSYYTAPWILLADEQGNVGLTTAQVQQLVKILTDNQGANGLCQGAYWGKTYDDIDTTGTSLAALARFAKATEDPYGVKAEAADFITKALIGLAKAQGENGSFGNVNTDAMVIAGLAAIGEDPSSFKNNNSSLADALTLYVNEGQNGFSSGYADGTAGEKAQALATEQGFRALVVLEKMKTGIGTYNIYTGKTSAATENPKPNPDSDKKPGSATGEGTPDSGTSAPSGGTTGGQNIIAAIRICPDSKTEWLSATHTLAEGSTAADLIVKALADAGMQSVGADRGYVKSVTKGGVTLAERDKGPNSGWMYTVNGSLPNVGIQDYRLKSGDSVKLYYVEDYTKDSGTSGWAPAPGGEQKPEDQKKDEQTTDDPKDNETKAEAAKVKALTNDFALKARSLKTAKGHIKVRLLADAKTQAAIKELQGMGYTVKYRFYRSTKKPVGYRSALTKKTTSYINTSGKKGTKYFYKGQIRVYDKNGKLIAKTALKQCKYATRSWTK